MSTAVACWEWILGARQDLEIQVNDRLFEYLSCTRNIGLEVQTNFGPKRECNMTH